MAENGESSQNSERMSDRETQNAVLFGKYEVGKLLGYGASAKVYQGKDLRTGDGVAIKVVKKQKLVQKGGLSAPVTREISIMRRLRHPHIVRLIEVLATKSKVYFIMELAKGGELFDKVLKGRFGENISRHYFQQLISAVRYCHGRGVFHRDLKPENLLLDENRKLKVSDFGLSAMREQMRQGEDGMMLLHTLCGTPAYVAPEILAGAKKGYDGAKADVWSCGVILFVLNAGYLPFNDTNLMSLYRKIYRGKFRVPTWTSASLFRLISRLLDPNPQTRITVEDILLDPWFKQGTTNLNEIVRFQSDDFDLDENTTTKQLNAFDIISSSSGLNLSGLFGNAITPDHCEQFVSDERPEEIIEKVEEVAKGMNLRIGKKKARAIKVVGAKGLFTVVVKLHRLTDDLVIVEIKNKESHRDVGIMWAEALRQKIRNLVSQPNIAARVIPKAPITSPKEKP